MNFEETIGDFLPKTDKIICCKFISSETIMFFFNGYFLLNLYFMEKTWVGKDCSCIFVRQHFISSWGVHSLVFLTASLISMSSKNCCKYPLCILLRLLERHHSLEYYIRVGSLSYLVVSLKWRNFQKIVMVVLLYRFGFLNFCVGISGTFCVVFRMCFHNGTNFGT